MRKLLLEIKRRDWDITLADFVDGVDAEVSIRGKQGFKSVKVNKFFLPQNNS